MTEEKTLIIGGGAAGLMAGIFSARSGRNTVIAEKNPKVGRKLYITGKGRCNVTNNCDAKTVIANTPTNGRFLYSALSAFSPADTIAFFEENGCPLKTERGGRVFPVSDKAADIVDTLRSAAVKAGCRFLHKTAEHIIIKNGSTGDGYRFAEEAGHTIIPLRPSLVPLETEEHYGYDADGLLLKNIGIRVLDTKKNKIIYTDFGELELKRWGLSGAVVRSASAHMKDMEPGRYKICIDMKPALDEKTLDARLLREIDSLHTGVFSDMLSTLMPRALIGDFAGICGIAADKRCSEITRAERARVVSCLKSMDRTVSGFRPIDEAIVTSGGVCVKEIDPKTMQSRLVSGLYFAGEVIDIDCYTGGFNIQAAFSTGFIASRS